MNFKEYAIKQDEVKILDINLAEELMNDATISSVNVSSCTQISSDPTVDTILNMIVSTNPIAAKTDGLSFNLKITAVTVGAVTVAVGSVHKVTITIVTTTTETRHFDLYICIEG